MKAGSDGCGPYAQAEKRRTRQERQVGLSLSSISLHVVVEREGLDLGSAIPLTRATPRGHR